MKMSRRAKRMERHHKRKGVALINMVSLMDIFTILVFFLLVNSTTVQNVPSSKTLQLPVSTAEKTPKETIVVMINKQDILVQGRKVADVAESLAATDDLIPGLLEELSYQAQRSRQDGGRSAGEITIMGDRQLPYLLLKKIMVTCTQAEYTNISLAVMQKHNKPG